MIQVDRKRAGAFGSKAELYDRARPTYPEALLDAVLGQRTPPVEVLDVGCGTGIVARQLSGRGARVLGVELDERMAGVARRSGVDVEVAPFEDWDPRGRTFDVLTAGQAWHWIEPGAGAAKAATVLRPGGLLALFWYRGRPPEDLAAELKQVYARVAPGAASGSVIIDDRPRDGHEAAIEGIRATALLSEPVSEHFAWQRTYTRAELLDQLPTIGGHVTLDPEVLVRLMDSIGEVIDQHGGSFTMSYDTELIRADRR